MAHGNKAASRSAGFWQAWSIRRETAVVGVEFVIE